MAVNLKFNIGRFLVDTNITVGVELALLRTTVVQHTKTYMTYPVSTEVKVGLDTGKLKTKLHLPERVMRDFCGQQAQLIPNKTSQW